MFVWLLRRICTHMTLQTPTPDGARCSRCGRPWSRAPQLHRRCPNVSVQLPKCFSYYFFNFHLSRTIVIFRHRFTSNRKKQHKFVGNIIPHSEIGKCGLCASLGANVLHTIEGAFLTSKTSPHLVPSAERVHVETCTRFVVRALLFPDLYFAVSRIRIF